MKKPTIIFFGSFLQYSQQVLEKLVNSDLVEVVGVITTPPRPSGRKQILTKTHVHQYAEKADIPVFTPEKLNGETLEEFEEWLKGLEVNRLKSQNSDDLSTSQLTNLSTYNPNLFLVAGYGKLLPKSWLAYPTIAPINIHFSLLPKYRGAMPGEWAMMMDEKESGVSLIEMSPKLDAGAIYAQAKYLIKEEDNRETLYKELYDLGADLFLDSVERYVEYKLKGLEANTLKSQNSEDVSTYQPRNSSTQTLILPPKPQPQKTEHLYARLLNKEDSYIPWNLIQLAMDGKSVEEISDLTPLMQELPTKILTQSGLAEAINRMTKALYGWPGVWTKVMTDKGEKRMKVSTVVVLKGKLCLDLIQIEGKMTTNFNEIDGIVI